MGRISLLCLLFAVVAISVSATSPVGHFQHGLQLTLDSDYIDAVTGGGATFFHNAAKVDLEQPLYSLHDSDGDEPTAAESANGDSIDPDCLLTSKEDLNAADLEAAMSLAELQSQHTREQRHEVHAAQDAGIGPLNPQSAPAASSKKVADKQLKEVVKALRSGVNSNSDSESVFPPRIVHDQGISLGAQAPVTLNDKNLLGAEFDVDLSSRVASHRAATNGDVGSPTKRLKCPHHLRSRPNAVSPLPLEGESHEAWKQDISRIIIPALDMLKPSPEKHEASDEYIGPDGFFRLKAMRPSITAQPDTVDTTMCKFPFTYGKVEHWGCTTFGSSKGRPWCMTRENAREGELPWAFCAEDCLSIARECNAVDNTNTVRKCVFPFVYEGVEYGNCTNVDRENYWCPFEVNPDGTAKEGKWGYCTDCKCADAVATDGEKCKHFSTFEKFKFKNARTYGCNNAGTEGPDNNAEPWCETVSGKRKTCPRLQHCEVTPATPKHVQASTIAGTLPSRISYASCYNIAEGGTDQELFQSVMERRPDLWLWIGDNIYADSLDMGKCGKVERDYKQLKEDPAYQLMTKAKVPMMFIWDDHDFGSNNAGKYFPGKDAAQKQFLDFFDVPPTDSRRTRPGVFNSQKFSNGSAAAKVVMVDVRYSRDPSHYFENEPCENTVSMLGDHQWSWLQNELLGDSADVLFLVSGIQVIPPLVTTSGKHPLCSFLPPHADRNLNAIRELGEEGLTGMNAEGWGEMPSERHRLLRLIQQAVNRGNYKKIVILSGDIHFAEITRMVIPATADLKPVEVLELTSSGIRQNWANVRSDPYRLPVVADTKGNNVFNQGCKIPFRHQGTWYKNCTSVPNPEGVSGKPWCYTQLTPRGKGVKDSWGYCAPAGATVPWGKQGRIGNPSVFARDPYKIQLATSNYGRVEIDWLRQEIALQVIAPHEVTAVAGDVAAETIVSFAGSPTLN